MRKGLVLLVFLIFSGVFALAGIPVPPPHHPRLYIDSTEIPILRQRMASEGGVRIIERMRSLAQPRTPEEEIPSENRDFRYYFQMRGLTSRAELLALEYLTEGNVAAGREAIVSVLDSLKRTSYGKEKDLSRANGVMLMVGAIVYDWCYPLLSAKEKSEYVSEFLRISSLLECGYPFTFVESLAGHTCEWMIMRDMLSASVAIYDEYPRMYNDVMDIIVNRFVPGRNLFYSAGNHPQGSNYIPTRYSCEMFAQRILAKFNGGKGIFSPDQQSVLYDVIYRMRPDGTLLPIGDDNPTRKPREENYALPSMMASSFYKDPHLRWLYLKNTDVIAHSLLFDLIWNDDSLAAESPEDLPLARYCPSPFGWMIARTGWDDACVIAEMKINEHLVGNHQHLDGGSFQIWYKGSLAIDSGIYEGVNGGYLGEHCRNYSKRTIAHNSLLIYNPDEKFAYYKARPHKNRPARYGSNDGGQRMPGPKGWDTAGSVEEMHSYEYTVGKTISHGISDDFCHLKGDITKAYSDKVDLVERSFVFCNLHDSKTPAALVVFDRINATDSTFRKTFLLHSIEEPEINDGNFVIRRNNGNENGLLHTTVLLPENPVVEKIGGPGKEFYVSGTNWPNYIKGDPQAEAGAWRVEVSPSSASRNDIFLNVMLISDDRQFRTVDVRKADCGNFIAAVFKDRMILFSKDQPLSGAPLRFNVKGTKKVLVCDLIPGEYGLYRNGRLLSTAEVRKNENTIEFSACGGEYEILKKL